MQKLPCLGHKQIELSRQLALFQLIKINALFSFFYWCLRLERIAKLVLVFGSLLLLIGPWKHVELLVAVLRVLCVREEVRLLLFFGWGWLLLVPVERYHVVIYEVDCVFLALFLIEVESASSDSVDHF